MKNIVMMVGLVVTALPVFAADQCETNFTKEGGFFKGTTFKTWANIEGVTVGDAHSSVYRHIAKDGWNIVSSDKEAGVLTASQTVSYGKGKTAPLNIIFEPNAETGTRISLSYALSGGVSSPKKAVIESFCATIASATGSSM
ncbi:hypothetical protein [Marinagarivorans cellulosilyticus]|uniref:Uncharacterized protein n=1 Tax=Marinagarivorans cellulosilyticus TaxID=2721545 RepID=A0AAN1WHL0_9GAMM|nr:hypothetical protein [Marinagarivorans cellulosilyticus]BCD97747.1 hypothetical protein MARGE09_P1948 [Marinagarivorans cellulosilyticus]